MGSATWAKCRPILLLSTLASCAGSQVYDWGDLEKDGINELLLHFHSKTSIAEGQFVSFEHLPRNNFEGNAIDGFREDLIASLSINFHGAIESLIANMRIQAM